MSKHANCNGCREYNTLNRRDFMRYSGLGLTALLAEAWLPRVAFAQSGANRDVVISIFLRGGADGLSLCVPHGDDGYYNARPSESIRRPGTDGGAIDLDGFFGLAPAMQSLYPVYDAGDLAIIHACGLTDSSRSHFDAMYLMETGNTGDSFTATGWLGRHLLNTGALDPNGVLRAIAVSPSLQRTLAGSPSALPVPDPGAFTFDQGDERLAILQELYAETVEPLRGASENTFRTLAALEAIDYDNYTPAGGAVYPNTGFGDGMQATAALIKAGIGVEAFALDLGGWDTHAGQGARNGGLANLMRELAEGLAAFHTDVIAAGNRNVVITVMSEFGRNVKENASQGTDHGYGSAMFVMGGHVNGGQVLGNWPGLAADELFEQQDLYITTDYRNVLAEILQKRAGASNLGNVFPGLTPAFPGGIA